MEIFEGIWAAIIYILGVLTKIITMIYNTITNWF